jgi:hypothetical protein
MSKTLLPVSILAACLSECLAGCAGLPRDQSIVYALPKATTTVSVTETLGCPTETSDDSSVRKAVSVAPNTIYSADNSHGLVRIPLDTFDQHRSDPDLSFTYYEDGRLKGINSSMAGQGPAIVKSVITLAALATTGLGGLAIPAQIDLQYRELLKGHAIALKPAPGSICAAIAEASKANKSGDDKPMPPLVTLTYTTTLSYERRAAGLALAVEPELPNTDRSPRCAFDNGETEPGALDRFHITYPAPSAQSDSAAPGTTPATQVTRKELAITPDVNTRLLLDQFPGLRGAAGKFCVGIVDATERPPSESQAAPSARGYTTLTLARITDVTLRVDGLVGPNGPQQFWKDTIGVPFSGQPYDLRIPSGTTFGTQTFSLALQENGAISSIQYKTSGGSSDLAASLDAYAKSRPEPKSEADTLSAKSDLIYEQQRLLACQLSPSECKK